jgi:hypothetical protein
MLGSPSFKIDSRFVDALANPLAGQSYSVAIRNNRTGEIKICKALEYWDPRYCKELWLEGPNKCDCFRSACFDHAGEDPPFEVDINDYECGLEAFAAMYVVFENGMRLILEEDSPDVLDTGGARLLN